VSSSGSAGTTSAGTTATTSPTTINIQETGKDFKPEELKNVADTILKILQEYEKLRLAEMAAAAAESGKTDSDAGEKKP
jgi:hypothetical protein